MANLDLMTLTPKIKYIGGAATEDLFGANLLFNRDGMQATSNVSAAYQEFAKEVGLRTIRYPGGTMSEVSFDLSDPNAQGAYEKGGKGTIPLSGFLEYAASIGATGTIVVPTYRFLSAEIDSSGNHTIDTSQEATIKEFVIFALSEAERLGTRIGAFELGNEWWADNSGEFGFKMSPVEYGRVANFLAETIEEAVIQYNFSQLEVNAVDPDIVIQVGPGGNAEWYSRKALGIPDEGTGPDISATEAIFKQITSPVAQGAIDGTLMHRYLHGTDSAIGEWVYRPFTTWDFLATKTPGFQTDVQRYVTEWNVSSRNPNELGLKQFDTMVLLLEEMLQCGVDLADVWAVQQNNQTKMIYNTGSKDAPYGGLTFAGLAFDMLAAQLPGQGIVLQPHNLQGLDSVVFGSEQKFVYFLTNKSETSRTDTLSFSKLPPSSHHVTIYSIEAGIDDKPNVTVRTFDLRTSTQAQILQFSPNETVMIVVARNTTGSVIEGYNQADVLSGSGYSDTILGGDNGDLLRGEDGDDSLDGETGNDSLYGGDGNDSLVGGAGDDLLYGGGGDDLIHSGIGHDTIFGGAGFDIIYFTDIDESISIDLALAQNSLVAAGGSFLSQIEGVISGGGRDIIYGESSDNLIFGGGGADTITGLSGNDTLNGDTDDDIIDGGDGDDRIDGGYGSDVLLGGNGSDIVRGGDGNDSIFGGSEVDVLEGGSGNDTVFGDAGLDILLGGEGDDHLDGGTGDDRILGDEGQDTMFGDDGFDFLDGGSGNDVMYGGADADYMIGGSGDDIISGDAGDDMMNGGYGNDLLLGGNGDDTIRSSDGEDTLLGGAGNDKLYGGSGDDVLFAGDGEDSLSGGSGRDQFVFGLSSGTAIITDFDAGLDRIVFVSSDYHTSNPISEFFENYVKLDNGVAIFNFGDSKLSLYWVGVDLTGLFDSVTFVDSIDGGSYFGVFL